MRPKLAIVGHPLIRASFKELLSEKGMEECSIYYEANFSQVPNVVEQIKEEKDIDVIITGWGHLHFFDELSIPVVAISVTGFDILNALTKAKRLSKNVVFMRFGSPFEVEKYSETVEMEIQSDSYLTKGEAMEKIRRFMAKGYNTFIGSGLMCDIVKELGGSAFFIYSRDSVASTLDQVWDLAVSRRTEIERKEQLRIILEHAREGIISLGNNLFCKSVNTEAEKLLEQARASLLERPIADFWPTQNINNCVSKASPIFSVIEKVNGKKFIVDYIPHFVNGVVSGIVMTFRDFRMVQEAEQVIRQTLYNRGQIARYSFADIAGSSLALGNAISLAKMYAQSDSTVLITGESGTGKELFAQSIHMESRRKSKPFIALNCAALTETLLDSELFGYEEGSFSGAKKGGKAGLFEIAHEGTLYLDEVGELSMEMQSRLLRVLQEKQIRRVGGNTWFHVDVRIITATNRNLKQMVAEGKFREDLYYRLNVLSLFVPPLRGRLEDIPQLVCSICEQHNELERAELIAQTITDQSADYNWPGNIRELENIVQRLLVAYEWKKENDQSNVFQMVFSDLATICNKNASLIPKDIKPYTINQEMLVTKETIRNQKREAEKELINKVLDNFGGNKSKTAQYLGISRSNLWYKLKD